MLLIIQEMNIKTHTVEHQIGRDEKALGSVAGRNWQRAFLPALGDTHRQEVWVRLFANTLRQFRRCTHIV